MPATSGGGWQGRSSPAKLDQATWGSIGDGISFGARQSSLERGRGLTGAGAAVSKAHDGDRRQRRAAHGQGTPRASGGLSDSAGSFREAQGWRRAREFGGWGSGGCERRRRRSVLGGGDGSSAGRGRVAFIGRRGEGIGSGVRNDPEDNGELAQRPREGRRRRPGLGRAKLGRLGTELASGSHTSARPSGRWGKRR